MIKGRDVKLSLYINGETRTVMAGKSCSYSINRDKIEVSSPKSGKMRNYVQTTIGASVSCKGLVADPAYLHDIEYVMANGIGVWVIYNVGGRCTNSFKATIDRIEHDGNVGSLATYSMDLTATSEITHGHAVYANTGEEVASHKITSSSISSQYGGGIMIVKVKIPCTSRITVTLGDGGYFMYASGDVKNDSIRTQINNNNISGLRNLGFGSPSLPSGLTSLNAGTYTFLMNKNASSNVLFQYEL